MTPLQFLLLVFGIFALSRAILRLKEGAISRLEFIFWGLVWSFMILIALMPDYLNSLAQITGIGRAIDVLVYLGIAGLFYLIFRVYVQVDEIKQNVTEMTREMANINLKLEKKNK